MLKSWGAINFAGSSFAQCRGPRDVGFPLTFGTGVGSPEPTDIANTELPRADRLAPRREHAQHAGAGIRARRSSGAFRSSSSTRASRSPRARRSTGCRSSPGPTSRCSSPGCNVLVTEGRYDRAFVEKYGHGFDKFAAEHRGQTRPSGPRTETASTPRLIRATAREFASRRAGLADPSRPAHRVVRRRHAAEPRGRAPERAPRQLGPQGRLLPRRRHEGRAVSAAEAAEVGPAAGRQPERRAAIRSPTRCSRTASATRRSPASRIRSRAGSSTRRTCCTRCRTWRNAGGDPQARPPRRRRHDAVRDRGLRGRRAARGTFLERYDELLTGFGPHAAGPRCASRCARAARPEARLVDRETAREQARHSARACPSPISRTTCATASRSPGSTSTH